MDTLTVIALIVVALIILAIVIRFRQRLILGLRFFGIGLNVEAEDRTQPGPPATPAGVRVEDAESSEGGLLIEEGRTQDPGGTGVEVKRTKTKDDIIIGKGESGDPKKAEPPA